jgi:phage-related holin
MWLSLALQRLRLLVAVFWAGSLWTIGYLVAPTLFATLHDSALAGTIVGSLLAREAWVSIVCAALLLVLVGTARSIDTVLKRRLAIVILVMLACALAIYLGVQPAMAALKEAAGGVSMRQSPQWTQFAILHGVSQLLYVVESVLAAVLVIRMR